MGTNHEGGGSVYALFTKELAPVPSLTPIGLIILLGVLSVIAGISLNIRRKRR